MVKLFAGEKGEGKTRHLIALAHEHLDKTDGHIVYIDDDKRNQHVININIRLVDTSDYPLECHREFVSFIYGMMSQNSDIRGIFIDSLSGVIKNLNNDHLADLLKSLEKISESEGVEFFITLNCNPGELSEEVKKYKA